VRKVIRSLVMLCAVGALVVTGVAPAAEGNAAAAAGPAGKVEKVRVHGSSLEGNLAGDDATRDVYVYLPPGYGKGRQRYPVIYFLHGFGVTAEVYKDAVLRIPAATDAVMGAGSPEFIIVMPDAFTRLGGSFYHSSPVIGDWETFIAKDLVAWVDSKYRTVARRDGRGLAGHSMGGYGTLNVGMRYPEVFAALYAMSSPALNLAPEAAATQTELKRMTPDMKAVPRGASFSNLAKSAAWAPNPLNPPFYFDLPFDTDGKPVPLVAEKWIANSPAVAVDQHVPALKSFRGLALDVGDQDGLREGNILLASALERRGVPHEFEVYEGTHGNKIGPRFIEKVLPFFARHLDTGKRRATR
jgi:enterochelin esterase-like enzyme